MIQADGNRRLFRFAVLAALIVLAVGNAWYARSLARLAPPSPVTSNDEMFDPVTGTNRMFFPTAADDVSGVTSVQGRTHLVLLAVVAVFVAVSIVPWKRRDAVASTRGFKRAVLVTYIASLAAAAWLLIRYRQSSGVGVTVGIVVCVLFLFGTKFAARPRLNLAIGIVSVVGIGMWYGPGFWIRVDLSRDPWWMNEIAEKHLALTTSFGDRLAQGLRLYRDVVPGYSGLLAIVKAAYIRAFGSTTGLTDVVFVEATHLVFMLVAAACFYIYSGRRWLIALGALLFLGSASNFAHMAFYHAPNHTAWRTLWFPVALLGACLAARLSPKCEAIVLGLLGGLGILQNLETGAAITAGLGWSLLCKTSFRARGFDLRVAITAMSLFVIGMGAAVAMHGAVCTAVLGYWPDYFDWIRQTIEVMKVGAAVGGGSFRGFDPLASVVFAHSAAIFIFETIRATRGPPHLHRCKLRLAAATMILVWFKYYFNRPDPEYLSSFYVLYAILLIDLFRVLAAARRRSRGVRETALLAAFIIVIVIAPRACLDYDQRMRDYTKAWNRLNRSEVPDNAVEISGFWLPDDSFAAGIAAKADFIRARSRGGSVAYLTENCYLVPKLSGVWSDLPVVQPFWESGSPLLFDKLVRSIVESKHDEIYFDDPATIATPTGPHPIFRDSQFYRYLKRALASDFEYAENISGWELWRRKRRAN